MKNPFKNNNAIEEICGIEDINRIGGGPLLERLLNSIEGAEGWETGIIQGELWCYKKDKKLHIAVSKKGRFFPKFYLKVSKPSSGSAVIYTGKDERIGLLYDYGMAQL